MVYGMMAITAKVNPRRRGSDKILAKIGLRESRVPIPSKFKRVESLNQVASITPKIFSRIVSIWPNEAKK